MTRKFLLRGVVGTRSVVVILRTRCGLAYRARMELDDVNSADEAAAYPKLTPEQVKAMARKGELAHIRAGRSYLFPRDAIEEWMQRNTRRAREPEKLPHGLTEGAWRNIQRGRRR